MTEPGQRSGRRGSRANAVLSIVFAVALLIVAGCSTKQGDVKPRHTAVPTIKPTATARPRPTSTKRPRPTATTRPKPKPTATSHPKPPTKTPVPRPTHRPVRPKPTPTPTQRHKSHHPSGFWHTKGVTVRNGKGKVVRIAAATWFGMDSNRWVPDGLNKRPYRAIMRLTKHLGFNVIRLPYSNQLVETNPIVTRGVAANPRFRGVHAMTVMDAIIRYAHKIGLKIILDDHRSAAVGNGEKVRLSEPYWYAPGYPESSWIHDWQTLARRYRHNDAVIGFDLRNEPHTGAPGPWSLNAYLNQGATWGPYNGSDNPLSDWRAAAQKAGDAALAINPHLLIFVEGVELYPMPGGPLGMDAYWWGGILTGVRSYPVVLNVAHRLVYSPHEYGPGKVAFPWFHDMTYRSLVKQWDLRWGFILRHRKARYAAPIWIGEWGTCTRKPTCVSKQEPSNQARWLHLMVRFFRKNPEVGWGFWALNGTNDSGAPMGDGILNRNWTGVENHHLQRLLRTIEK